MGDSYGHKLSHLLCKILKEVDEDQETICDSTEDMLAAINKVNIEQKENDNKEDEKIAHVLRYDADPVSCYRDGRIEKIL